MDKPWKVVLVFVGVFVAGAIFGGPLIGRWMRPNWGGPRPLARLQIMNQLEQELNLTDAQKAKIGPLVQKSEDETRRLRRESLKAIAALMEQLHGQVAAELTPEQKVKLDDMRKRFRDRADKMRREFREGDHPPGMPPPPPPEDGGDLPPPPPPRN